MQLVGGGMDAQPCLCDMQECILDFQLFEAQTCCAWRCTVDLLGCEHGMVTTLQLPALQACHWPAVGP